jgi:hypothetical protein
MPIQVNTGQGRKHRHRGRAARNGKARVSPSFNRNVKEICNPPGYRSDQGGLAIEL